MSQLSPEYRAYMQSPEWDDLRRFMLHRAGYKCGRCHKGNRVLQVHHKNYARLGHERVEDLMVLCVSCHRWVHWRKSVGKWAKKVLTVLEMGV